MSSVPFGHRHMDRGQGRARSQSPSYYGFFDIFNLPSMVGEIGQFATGSDSSHETLAILLLASLQLKLLRLVPIRLPPRDQNTRPSWKNHLRCPLSPMLPPKTNGPTAVSARTPRAKSLGNLLASGKPYILPNS
jgi:hypothetical protein